MNSSGHTTVRGPFGSTQKRKIADLVQSHVFNSEVTCYLPILRDNASDKKPKEEVKWLDLEEEDDEDDTFLSFKSSASGALDDAMLVATNSFHYRIKGRCELLFEEPFFSTYVSAPNGITLSTIHTPAFFTNSLCLFRGEFVVIKLDKESYYTLGLPAKRSSARLLRDNTYISVMHIKELRESGRLLQRLQSCLRDLPPLEMICYNDDREVSFPEGYEVTKVENTITTRRVSGMSVPRLSEAVLMKGMVMERLEADEMAEKVILERKALQRIVGPKGGTEAKDREEVLNGLLDWLGCVEARCCGMSVEMDSLFSSFTLSPALHYTPADAVDAVAVYKECGLCSKTRVLEWQDGVPDSAGEREEAAIRLSRRVRDERLLRAVGEEERRFGVQLLHERRRALRPRDLA